MITMGGFRCLRAPSAKWLSGSIDVIVQAERMRDGSRRITKITEVVTGTEGEVIITQDLMTYEISGEDEAGRIPGQACRRRDRCDRHSGKKRAISGWSANSLRALDALNQ